MREPVDSGHSALFPPVDKGVRPWWRPYVRRARAGGPYVFHRLRARPAALLRRLLRVGAREQGRQKSARERVPGARRVPGHRRYGRDMGVHFAGPGEQRAPAPCLATTSGT
ncbi:hypothetical protein SHKM778_69740 [Streptomyces sp. KM77-8]|uniref:Uncharacterized protein n=1 Tax=Streptomyces haneummycinicus TaxID=3074435 RepID=A0AAT9HSK8_9ACTN